MFPPPQPQVQPPQAPSGPPPVAPQPMQAQQMPPKGGYVMGKTLAWVKKFQEQISRETRACEKVNGRDAKYIRSTHISNCFMPHVVKKCVYNSPHGLKVYRIEFSPKLPISFAIRDPKTRVLYRVTPKLKDANNVCWRVLFPKGCADVPKVAVSFEDEAYAIEFVDAFLPPQGAPQPQMGA